MKRLYIIGDPVEHSLSPVMQNAALEELGLDNEFSYNRLRVPKDELEQFIQKVRTCEIAGASVTMPDKEHIIPLLDELTAEAELIQAVNTVFKKEGRIIGHNTDGTGCVRAIGEYGVDISDKEIVLLGAGGAARAIAVSLALEGAGKLHILNRNIKKAEELARKINKVTDTVVIAGNLENITEVLKHANILINATSVGMKGDFEEQSLVPADIIRPGMVVNDIVYNPKKTRLLREAESAGAKIIDGIDMLMYQGAAQFEIFTGRDAPIDVMKSALSGYTGGVK